MNNEKILSDSELLNITGGSQFLKKTQVDPPSMNNHIVVCKYGVYHHIPYATKMYGVKPVMEK